MKYVFAIMAVFLYGSAYANNDQKTEIAKKSSNDLF